MNFKLLALLLLSSSQLTFSAEADWEVLNMALDNINAANPSVLANSILNILSGFLPSNQPIPITVTLPPVTTRPNTQPPIFLNIDPTPAPAQPAPVPAQPAPFPAQPAPAANPSSSISQLFLLYPELYKQMIQSMMPMPVVPTPVVSSAPAQVPTITQLATSVGGCDCDCKKKPKSIAEFLVNVPYPTTTEKPPKRIVVKVPCPTTTTTTEKPCGCQCCSCNSAPQKLEKQPKKAKKYHEESVQSESEESSEIRTVFKAYEAPRKSNSVRNQLKYAEDCSSEENH